MITKSMADRALVKEKQYMIPDCGGFRRRAREDEERNRLYWLKQNNMLK